MPAFLHGPLWNQMPAPAAVMENAETPYTNADFSKKERTLSPPRSNTV